MRISVEALAVIEMGRDFHVRHEAFQVGTNLRFLSASSMDIVPVISFYVLPRSCRPATSEGFSVLEPGFQLAGRTARVRGHVLRA